MHRKCVASRWLMLVVFTGLCVAVPGSAQTTTAGGGSMLDGYKLVKGPVIPEGVEDDLSGITYDAKRDTLLAILNKPTRIIEMDRDGKVLGAIALDGFDDTEDLVSLGDGRVVVLEERRRVLSVCEIPAGVQAVPRPAIVMLVETQSYENVGIEGVVYDAAANRYFVVKEKEPRRLYVVTPGTDGATVTHPWDLETQNFGLADFSAIARDAATGHLLLLSDESRCIVECTEAGVEVGRLSLNAGSAGLTEDVTQPEGLAFDPQGRLYVVAEPNRFYVFAKE